MRAVFVTLLFVAGPVAWSQTVEWNSGTVVLRNGEVRSGEVSFQHNAIVLFRKGDSVRVLPAHQVHAFRFYDARLRMNRRFVTLAGQSQILNVSFYEQVVAGEVGVVRRLKSYAVGMVARPEDFECFILQDSTLVPLQYFRSRIYPMLISRNRNFSRVLAARHLNPNRPADVIPIVREFNQGMPPVAALAGR